MKQVPDISSREVAQECADFLFGHEEAIRSLGLKQLSIETGKAVVAMTVQPAMVSESGVTHGGAIFALADAVFSLACNTSNKRAVATHCSISFLSPTRLGDYLIATATEVVRTPRSAIYEVIVTSGDELVAEFRANARAVGGPLLPTSIGNMSLEDE